MMIRSMIPCRYDKGDFLYEEIIAVSKEIVISLLIQMETNAGDLHAHWGPTD